MKNKILNCIIGLSFFTVPVAAQNSAANESDVTRQIKPQEAVKPESVPLMNTVTLQEAPLNQQVPVAKASSITQPPKPEIKELKAADFSTKTPEMKAPYLPDTNIKREVKRPSTELNPMPNQGQSEKPTPKIAKAG